MPEIDNLDLLDPLRKVPFLSMLQTQDLYLINDICSFKVFEGSSNIFIGSDFSDGLYILLAGKVEIYLNKKSFFEKKVLKVINPGDFFGEIGLIDGLPRSASARTTEKSKLLFLPKLAFDTTLKYNARISEAVFNHLVKIVLELPKFQIKNQKIKTMLENNLLEPNLETFKTLCWAIRENNKNIYVS